MADRLLRVTAVAGARRSDLAVPDGVALAELVPDLARSVGLLDPAAVYAGYRVLVRGRQLRPEQGLREQGVDDGALLAVAAGAEDDRPPSYDDLAEATADAVARRRTWTARDTRRALRVSGSAGIAVAAGCALARPAAQGLDSLAARGVAPAVVAAVGLVLVVLAGNGLPALAATSGVARAGPAPVDGPAVERLVGRSTEVLAAASVAVAASAALAVPFVARTAAGTVLAADCGLVLLLRARRARAAEVVLADIGGGVLVLAVTAATLAAAHPDRALLTACVTALLGAACVAAAGLPPPPPALRARVADLAETGALVLLVPLLAVAAGGAGLLAGA